MAFCVLFFVGRPGPAKKQLWRANRSREGHRYLETDLWARWKFSIVIRSLILDLFQTGPAATRLVSGVPPQRWSQYSALVAGGAGKVGGRKGRQGHDRRVISTTLSWTDSPPWFVILLVFFALVGLPFVAFILTLRRPVVPDQTVGEGVLPEPPGEKAQPLVLTDGRAAKVRK